MSLSPRDVEALFRHYGLSQRSDGSFESTRRTYRQADVEQAFRAKHRDAAMVALKELGQPKPGARQ